MSTLSEMVPGFLRYLESSTKLREGTRIRYGYEVERLDRYFGGKDFAEITPQDLLGWNQMLYDAGAAKGTAGQKHSALRQFLSFVDDFLEDPHATRLLRALRRLRPPSNSLPVRETYALDEGQVSRLLQAASENGGVGIRDRALIHFFWATGVRRGEISSVQLADVDLERRTAVVLGKGSKERTVIFDEACLVDLEEWIELREQWQPETGHLFISARGRALNDSTVGSIIRDTGKKAGIRKDVWPHIFRHSRVTHLLSHGMAIQEVAVFAGHENINTTQGYYHQEPERLKESYDRATQRRRRPQSSADSGEPDSPGANGAGPG